MRRTEPGVMILFGALCLLTSAASAGDFFAKDPEAVYSKEPYLDKYVVEIPGYKLDPQSALSIPVSENEFKNARHIDRRILKKASAFIKSASSKKNGSYSLYAAKDLENHVLLYFTEPRVSDGGFELIYSKKLKKIIGFFSAGYKG